MRRHLAVYVAAGVIAGSVIGWSAMRKTSAPAPAIQQPLTHTGAGTLTETAVPRVSVDDLKRAVDGGQVTVIDVRDADSYLAAHIPGAIHIPLSYIEGELQYLPRTKPIVAYCT